MFRRLQPVKSRITLLVALLLGVGVLMVFLKQCSSEPLILGGSDTPDRHAPGDTVKVAIELSPVSMSMTGDSLGGEYYTLLQRISRGERLPIKLTPFSSIETALEGLQKGRYDVVVADQPVIASLRDKFLFTDPVSLDKQLLVQLKDEEGKVKVTDQVDLRGDTIWLPAGSPFKSRVVNLSHEIGDTIYVIEDNDYAAEQLVMLTALGEVKRTIANERTFEEMRRHYPRLDGSVDISFTQFQSWVVSKKREALRDSLNVWIKRYHE